MGELSPDLTCVRRAGYEGNLGKEKASKHRVVRMPAVREIGSTKKKHLLCKILLPIGSREAGPVSCRSISLETESMMRVLQPS